jgi:hypothetical protein
MLRIDVTLLQTASQPGVVVLISTSGAAQIAIPGEASVPFLCGCRGVQDTGNLKIVWIPSTISLLCRLWCRLKARG